MKPPAPAGELLALGFEADGPLASVVHVGLHESREWWVVHAIATRLGRRGQGYGRHALAVVIDVLARTNARAEISPGMIARIDQRNTPSQELFRWAGFEYIGESRGYQNWVRDL